MLAFSEARIPATQPLLLCIIVVTVTPCLGVTALRGVLMISPRHSRVCEPRASFFSDEFVEVRSNKPGVGT